MGRREGEMDRGREKVWNDAGCEAMQGSGAELLRHHLYKHCTVEVQCSQQELLFLPDAVGKNITETDSPILFSSYPSRKDEKWA